MAAKPEKTTIVVAVDIEKTGALFAHPVNSIGFYIAPEVENPSELSKDQIETFKWNIIVNMPEVKDGKVVDYGDFDPQCWDEFWSKQPDALARCTSNPSPIAAANAWHEIAKMIDSLEEKYPDDKFKIKFISDNASFDVATVNYCLEKYTRRLPMRYSSKGKWRSLVAHKDVFWAMPDDVQKRQMELINRDVNHDHDPVNDAHYHYLMYISTKFPNRK